MNEAGPSPTILYQDVHLLVSLKPAGISTQGTGMAPESFEWQLRRHLDPAAPESVPLHPIHRLDKPVGGLMVWGRNPRAARRLSDQFAKRQVLKGYWAVVSGVPAAHTGVWHDWLCLEDTGVGVVQTCRPETPRAREAVTWYRVGSGGTTPAGTSWLELWLETGRRHQIRAQAAAHGLPILGDESYGSSAPFPCGIALMSRLLRFRHPVSGVSMRFEARPPSYWEEAGISLPSETPEPDDAGLNRPD